MSNKSKSWLLLLMVAMLIAGTGYVAISYAREDGHSEEKGHDHDEAENGKEHAEEGGHGEEHGDETKISDESAANMQIEVLEVGAATVHQTIGLTGKITLNQNKTAQVRARFPGVVRSVTKGIGERVTTGETLATVESNDSLQVYPIKAPYAGTVIERNANIGDVAESEPLFVVADLTQMWAEFFIFSRDLEKVHTGQKIDIKSLSDDNSTEATVTNLLPLAESSSQTVIARVTIDNADGKWRSGMTVRGDVVLSEKEVAVAVKTMAIQRQEGAMVVYVQEGEKYEARKVQLGNADREWTEVLNGLKAGEKYVANNSFVVKADIGKAAAEHAH